jgi:hypothetical protein
MAGTIPNLLLPAQVTSQQQQHLHPLWPGKHAHPQWQAAKELQLVHIEPLEPIARAAPMQKMGPSFTLIVQAQGKQLMAPLECVNFHPFAATICQ